MKLFFLGTGAADWPLKKAPGKFGRYFSSTLIDDHLLIDPGPCVLSFEKDCGKPLLDSVTDILLTHCHSDHYAADTLSALASRHPITFYATEAVRGQVPDVPGLTFVPIVPFVPFSIGDYTVLPLPGSHSTQHKDEQPVVYVISHSGKCLFYGLDGAWLPNKTFNVMKHYAFDAMVWDCTSGDVEGEFRIFEHNTIPMLEYMLKSIRLSFPSMLKPGCQLIADHMAMTLHTDHAALEERLNGFGMTAAYDGREITL